MAFFTLLDWGNRAFWISVSPTTQTSGFSILIIISPFMGDHAYETSMHVAVTLHDTFILLHKPASTCQSVDEILLRDRSNETCAAVLSHGSTK